MTKDWDSAYREKGIIQPDVVPIVSASIEILKSRGVKRVLDVSFGTGRHTVFLAENGFDTYGIDVSDAGKKITETKIREKGLKAHLQIADMKNMPFDDGFFDAVIAVHTLQHNTIIGLRKTISEITRVLKPKGILVATSVSKNDPRFSDKRNKKIAPDTFIHTFDPDEADVPHYYCDEKTVKELFSEYNFLKFEEEHKTSPRRNNVPIAHFVFIAEKK